MVAEPQQQGQALRQGVFVQHAQRETRAVTALETRTAVGHAGEHAEIRRVEVQGDVTEDPETPARAFVLRDHLARLLRGQRLRER